MLCPYVNGSLSCSRSISIAFMCLERALETHLAEPRPQLLAVSPQVLSMDGDSLVFLLFFPHSPSININITQTPAPNLKSAKRLEKENVPGKPGRCNWPNFGRGRRRKEDGQRSQQCSLAHTPRGRCLPAGGSGRIYRERCPREERAGMRSALLTPILWGAPSDGEAGEGGRKSRDRGLSKTPLWCFHFVYSHLLNSP